MKIPVVIPCFNAASFLPSALASILKQGIGTTEIIIVDDASVDDTIVVAERAQREVKNLRIIRRTLNEGCGKARNVGLRQTRGEYVCFLDADDAYSDAVFVRCLDV